MTVDLLCKVVDNYGDIGVVYRLAKAMSALRPDLSLRIVVDKPDVFAALVPGIDPAAAVQTLRGWTIVRWDAGAEVCRANPPRRVVEAFACGLPEWFAGLLHDPGDDAPRVHVVLEYLTAEDWASEFHLLPSLSPCPQVRKVYCLPGFKPGTAGLIHDPGFLAVRAERDAAAAGNPAEAAAGPFTVCVFAYEHDFRPLVAGLAAWQAESGRPVLARVAAGRSAGPFREAWDAAGRPFAAEFLPFLPQEDWDRVLLGSDFALVRGEESLSRAALGGRPFAWHAYLQDGGHQRVKAEALIETVLPWLEPEAGQSWAGLMAALNERLEDSAERPAGEDWLGFLRVINRLASGFRAWAGNLEGIGDCAAGVLSLLDDSGYIVAPPQSNPQ